MKVLVSLNTDEWAEAVLPSAVAIARNSSEHDGASLVLLTVVPTAAERMTTSAGIVSPGELLARAGSATRIADTAAAAAMEYLSSLRARLLASPGGGLLSIDVRVEPGRPADTIIRIANEIGADIIALANRGPKGLRRSTLTRINDRVIRSSGRPILIVTV